MFFIFDLAKIKQDGSFHILDFKYEIEFEDKDLESKSYGKNINCKTYNDNLLEIQGVFDFKDWINFVEIHYIDDNYIEVTLNNFNFPEYFNSFVSEEKEKFVCREVDYNILYKHIIDVYFQRGFLLDLLGLKGFYYTLKRVCDLVNNRKLKHKKLKLKTEY